MKWTGLVLLLDLFVLKCWAMSRSELEEFSDFLEKTSQLDLNLKSNPDVDADEDNTVPDNAWEESGKFEGDLILNEKQRRLIVEDVAEGLSRNGLRDSTKRWPDNEVVFFVQREHFSEEQLQAIQNGIEDIAQASCVKFRPYRKGDRDAVVIQGSRRGCFSQVGYQGGYQVLNLNGRHPVGRGCFRHGTVVHELLHTLGFYHMQSSPDRDDYIDVIWENIVQAARHNFRKYNTFSVSDFGVGYDYDSVLHYSKKAFSSNGENTLVPKKNGADIGQRVGLSEKDTQKLNKMYCDADSNSDDAGSHVIKKKKPNKKKNPKNKPFEGHGIGYHQGKTVVIKLPAAETYRLPDVPTFHKFDYFSKTPQAVQQTYNGNSGIGSKITLTQNLPTSNPESVHEADVPAIIEFYNKVNRSENNERQPSKDLNIIEKTGNKNDHNDRTNSKVGLKNVSPQEENPNENTFEDIRNEFERLNKEIINRVYPSEDNEEDEEVEEYKNKHYYSDFNSNESPYIKDGSPRSKYSGLEETKENKEHNDDNEPPNYALNETVTEKLNRSNERKLPKHYHNVEEMDSTFRTSLPMYYPKYFIKDDDTESMKEDLYHRNNYAGLYIPNRKDEDVKHHKLFGEIVPTNEDWNNNEEFKRHHGDYDIASYSNYKKLNYESTPDTQVNTLRYLKDTKPENSKSHVKQAHHIFGEPVPLRTNVWYKIPNAANSYTEQVNNENNNKKDYHNR